MAHTSTPRCWCATMERDGRYSAAVYGLCERAKSTNAIEVGLGHMQSGQSIVKSLANRAPASLYTIDVSEYKLPDDMVKWSESVGVSWVVRQADASLPFILDGHYDFAHIDGVGDDPDSLTSVYKTIGERMIPGSIFAIAGAGPEYPRIMDWCNTIGGFTLEMFGGRSGHAVKVL